MRIYMYLDGVRVALSFSIFIANHTKELIC